MARRIAKRDSPRFADRWCASARLPTASSARTLPWSSPPPSPGVAAARSLCTGLGPAIQGGSRSSPFAPVAPLGPEPWFSAGPADCWAIRRDLSSRKDELSVTANQHGHVHVLRHGRRQEHRRLAATHPRQGTGRAVGARKQLGHSMSIVVVVCNLCWLSSVEWWL